MRTLGRTEDLRGDGRTMSAAESTFSTEQWVKQGRYRTAEGRRAHSVYDPQHGTCLLVEAKERIDDL